MNLNVIFLSQILNEIGINVVYTDKKLNINNCIYFSKLNNDIINCNKCNLYKSRKNVVIGNGKKNASWLFVGEAPGFLEDILGKPFVGLAGKLFNNILLSINLKKKNIYITNIIKCRPIDILGKDRTPLKEEIESCIYFLYKQIILIKPKIIIALGKIAALSLLKNNTLCTVNSLRKKIHYFNKIPLIVTYHPAYLLRKPTDKIKIWKDLCLAKKIFNNLK